MKVIGKYYILFLLCSCSIIRRYILINTFLYVYTNFEFKELQDFDLLPHLTHRHSLRKTDIAAKPEFDCSFKSSIMHLNNTISEWLGIIAYTQTLSAIKSNVPSILLYGGVHKT